MMLLLQPTNREFVEHYLAAAALSNRQSHSRSGTNIDGMATYWAMIFPAATACNLAHP